MVAYIDLVNRLRNRFNEVSLNTGTWSIAVGFDQFCKEAINYAYHDILNAEMEWPFLHNTATLLTIPGVQFYALAPSPANPSSPGYTSPIELKSFDNDKFYISPNATVANISNETHTIPASSTYTIAVTGATSWSSDLGVKYTSSGIALTPVIGDPLVGQYSITPTNGPIGTYVFNASDAGLSVEISYTTTVAATIAQIENAQYLQYITYDFWCQNFLQRDLDAAPSGFALPNYIFRTQQLNQIGLSPVPDKIYQINFEYWADGADMVATTDVPLLPSHFWQTIIDGASKYVYEFRDDPQQAQLADARFKAGITRMRIELINRDQIFNAGFNWVRGSGYSSPFVF